MNWDFFAGFICACIFLFLGYRFANPCQHTNTEHVTKCIDCGKVFNDGISEMRKRL